MKAIPVVGGPASGIDLLAPDGHTHLWWQDTGDGYRRGPAETAGGEAWWHDPTMTLADYEREVATAMQHRYPEEPA